MDRQEQEHLTMFGQWLDALCQYVELEGWKELAERAGLSPSTLSKNTRGGNPRRETVEKLCAALRDLAHEQGKEWREEWEEDLFHAAQLFTDAQMRETHERLKRFKEDILQQ